MELVVGVKILGTVTGDFFMINHLIRMDNFKILITLMLQLLTRGYRHCPPKCSEKCRLIALKNWGNNVAFLTKRGPAPKGIYVVFTFLLKLI